MATQGSSHSVQLNQVHFLCGDSTGKQMILQEVAFKLSDSDILSGPKEWQLRLQGLGHEEMLEEASRWYSRNSALFSSESQQDLCW